MRSLVYQLPIDVLACRMSSNESAGRVTRAFNDWFIVDRDQRAFLRLGLRFSREAYDRLWTQTGEEPGDPDGPDLLEAFTEQVEGLWPLDFEWMHATAALRDAVTNFEVYLEKVREEILEHHGYPRDVPERSPGWDTLQAFFLKLELEIDTDDVHQVRDLRHFLTHRRGELRTESLRKRFAADAEGLPPIVVEVGEDEVLTAMNTLADAVQVTDRIAYAHTWGGVRIDGLAPSS